MADTVTPAQLAAVEKQFYGRMERMETRFEKKIDEVSAKMDRVLVGQGQHPNPTVNFFSSRTTQNVFLALVIAATAWLSGHATLSTNTAATHAPTPAATAPAAEP